MRERYDWLFHPVFAKVELARMLPELNDPPEKLRAPLRVNDAMSFRLLIRNVSAESKVLIFDSPYRYHRPGLYKGGALTHFKKKLGEKGADSLVKRLYDDDSALAPPEGHSDAWKAGFRGAINSLRERIRQANVDGGLPEIEAALQRPFDTTDN